MKILFLGNEKGMFANLANWINTHTAHTAQSWEKLKEGVDEEGNVYILPCPMTDPDLIVCIDNFVMFEDEAAMGLVKNTSRKRVLYITGAPFKRGGLAKMDPRYKDFNNHYFCQTELDRQYFIYDQLDVLTGTINPIEYYPNLTFLPLPVDNILEQATVRTDELIVTKAESFYTMSGAYRRGLEVIKPACKDVGVKLDIIHSVPREEALVRKANSNLVFGDSRGNIGVSALESLAQGLPVIGCYHPITIENYERLGGTFPCLCYTSEQDLRDKLTAYKADLSQLVTLGQASRDWMQTYYTNQAIANYWCTQLEAIL